MPANKKQESRVIVHRPPYIIHQFASLGSTNDELKSMPDLPEFTCVVAEQQTAGRGRRDRRWHSSPGDGLYLSVLLLPNTTTKLSLLSLIGAVAMVVDNILSTTPNIRKA